VELDEGEERGDVVEPEGDAGQEPDFGVWSVPAFVYIR
jgi:hypothetical protein